MLFISIAFWCCAVLTGYTYIAYPLSMGVWSLFCRRSQMVQCVPPVTFLISAFNEALLIRQKIENTLTIDYPRELLEILVISDASDDGTDEIVEEFADQGVKLCRQALRKGKSAGLQQFVSDARGDIVIFSDANSMYEPGAVRKMVRHFADATIGYVVGHQAYAVSEGEASVSESLYWRYETWIKQVESRVGCVVGGDGAILAIRKELFPTLRDDDISDFIIPLRIVACGFRGVFDREAICYEHTASNFGGEFRRKVRIVNRSLRAVFRVPKTLNPACVGLFAYQLAVHKLIRWFVPLFLVVMLLSSLLLGVQGQAIYQCLLGLQVSFYLLAALRMVPGVRDWKAVYISFYFDQLRPDHGVLKLYCFDSSQGYEQWNS